MRAWLHTIQTEAITPPLVLLTVLRTAGSTPREAGAQMLVTRERTWGSIGGGRLEFDEIAAARALIGDAVRRGDWCRAVRKTILGPDAGQCCGGSVEVLHERIGTSELSLLQALSTAAAMVRPLRSGVSVRAHAATDAFVVSELTDDALVIEPVVRPTRHVIVYGGGHVAAALQIVLQPLPFAVTIAVDSAVVDTAIVTHGTGVMRSPDLAATAREAPADAIHLVMTHSHDLDYAICDALFRRPDCAFVGLIGSVTKRARFVQRFARSGHSAATVTRLVCPIGIDGVPGKAPAVIAIAVAAQLLARFPPP